MDLDSNFEACTNHVSNKVCIPFVEKELNNLSLALNEELKSKNWLLSNVQNTWWNKLRWRKYPVKSRFCDAHLCEIW